MFYAIKIGDERVLLNNITNVSSRMSNQIRQLSDGCWSEDPYMKADDTDAHTALVVTVYFVAGYESDYVKFVGSEAEEFLKQFDGLTGIAPVPVIVTVNPHPDKLNELKVHIKDAIQEAFTGEF